MTEQATAAAIEPRPRYDQQVSVLVTDEMKAFLRGAVADGPSGLKEADVVRALLDAGIDAMVQRQCERGRDGDAWFAAMVTRGRDVPPVTRDR